MKWAVLAGLCFLIAIVFTVPIFYEASSKGRVLKVSRLIVNDMMLAKRLSLKKGETCGLKFDVDKNSYALSCGENGTMKTMEIKSISRDVVISNLFKDSGSVFDSNVLAFGPDGKLSASDASKNSIYLINIHDEKNSTKEDVIRIFVDISGRIEILKVDRVFPNGDLEFEPL